MFSLKIVDADAFLDMPQTCQLLYFHLGMRADDDGFISNPKRVMKMIGSQDDDMKVLLSKRFIISFSSGVCVIKHWKINNYIQNDRYIKTSYTEELKGLTTKENGAYTDCIQNVSNVDTQIRLDKVSIDKKRLGESREEKKAKEVSLETLKREKGRTNQDFKPSFMK